MGSLDVSYLILKSGITVTKHFDDVIECAKFLRKAKYSKRIIVISCPLFP